MHPKVMGHAFDNKGCGTPSSDGVREKEASVTEDWKVYRTLSNVIGLSAFGRGMSFFIILVLYCM